MSNAAATATAPADTVLQRRRPAYLSSIVAWKRAGRQSAESIRLYAWSSRFAIHYACRAIIRVAA